MIKATLIFALLVLSAKCQRSLALDAIEQKILEIQSNIMNVPPPKNTAFETKLTQCMKDIYDHERPWYKKQLELPSKYTEAGIKNQLKGFDRSSENLLNS